MTLHDVITTLQTGLLSKGYQFLGLLALLGQRFRLLCRWQHLLALFVEFRGIVGLPSFLRCLSIHKTEIIYNHFKTFQTREHIEKKIKNIQDGRLQDAFLEYHDTQKYYAKREGKGNLQLLPQDQSAASGRKRAIAPSESQARDPLSLEERNVAHCHCAISPTPSSRAECE